MNRTAMKLAARAALCVALPAATPGVAQITVTIRADHNRYLLYEPMPVTVTIRNEFNAPLVFGDGEEAAEFAFDVEQAPGDPVRALGPRPVERLQAVPPWQSESFVVDLLRTYQIHRQGPYRIVARVTIGDMDFVSNRLLIDVLPGMELQRASAVAEDGSRRSLSLRTLVRARHEYVFLQILDEDRSIRFTTRDLGTIIRHVPPLLRVGQDGSVHVLHQSAPARITHSVTTLDGGAISATFYGASAAARPDLVADRRGRLRVVGVEPYRGDPVVEPVRPPPPPRR